MPSLARRFIKTAMLFLLLGMLLGLFMLFNREVYQQ